MLTAQLYLNNDGADIGPESGGATRAERRPVKVGATLRDDKAAPLDAEIVNLSTSGCLIRVAADLPVPSNVTIGIAGIGRIPAWIMRREGGAYGCFFLHPLSDAAVAEARAVETVVPFAAPVPTPHAAPVSRPIILSDRQRALIIVLCALAAWGVVAAIALIAGALLR